MPSSPGGWAEGATLNPEGLLPLIDLCPPLARLPIEPRRRLAAVSRKIRFEAGEHLVSLLRPQRRILILLDGWAKLVAITEEGIERILYVYTPCEIIGSRFLLEDDAESPYEVVAMEKIRALTISQGDFLSVANECPEVMKSVTSVLLERVDRLSSWMLAAISMDASLRLTKLLLDFADVDEASDDEFVPLKSSVTHETMAQIIGTTRPHTTTLLRDLEREGVVRRVQPRGLLVLPRGLERRLRDAGIRPGSRWGRS